MKTLAALSLAAIPLFISGCGGGDSSTGSGTLSVNLTDAPIDEANAVVIEFTGVSIKRKSGTATDDTSGWTEITFNQPMSIDLLTLQGSNHISLLSEQSLPAGTYSEIRLHVNAKEDTIFDSYIVLTNGNRFELDIPSGAQTGLKVKGEITIPENGAAGFTIDFDVRKSIVVSGTGKYKLKPVLHLTEDTLTGHVSGTVAPELLTTLESNWTCSDVHADTFNAVYVFTGPSATPIDINTLEIDREPVTTSLVAYNSTSGAYEYEVGYLPAGDYTLAFTCHADAENIEASGDDLQFIGMQNGSVIAGETALVEITAPLTPPAP